MPEFSSFHDFQKHAVDIVEAANEAGVHLRIMGGAAIRIHFPEFDSLYKKMGRLPKHDMDFVTYSKFRPKTKEIFRKFGYSPFVSLAMMGATGRNRQIFNDSAGNRAVDVFFDKLEMCHVIEFKGRLELDSPTIPPTELLLQKMQIVETNEKDIQDSIVLLRACPLGENDTGQINVSYTTRILARDWGFYHTFTTNLGKLRDYASNAAGLHSSDREIVVKAANALLERIEQEPKGVAWKLRAKVGTGRRWYTVVEEVER